MFAYFDINNAWIDYEDSSTPLDSFINLFDTSTGVATIECNPGPTELAPSSGTPWRAKTVITMRIRATSTYSLTRKAWVDDEFTLSLSDTCGANEIALGGS